MDKIDSDKEICALVRKTDNDYVTGTTTLGKYVEFSQYENLEKIQAYLNSKHVSGKKDSMGRDKPFFNIVTGAVNIWYRATDIDRKNIRIKATKSSDYLAAFLATIHLQDWMRRDNFGVFLNEWGRVLAGYGSCVIKFVTKGGRLHVEYIPWNRIICDTVDFENNVKIERLFFTPAQLKKNKNYDQKVVKGLLDAVSARQTADRKKIDNKNNYIEVYEVHGELPLSYITEDARDNETYTQQMHVVSYVKSKDTKGEYDNFTLLKGREKKDPYMITHLIKEDGRTQSIGAVEHLFDAQWMTNHTAKSIKDQLDLASKLIFQTTDGNFVGRNALTSVETGDILVYEGQPITEVNNSSHDITSLQSFGSQWQALAKEITSTPDAISGNTMPSGTAYRQVAILNQESHSLFEIMTENKGLAIEAMMRNYIIPYLKTQMDTSKEIAATLEAQGLTQIDTMYVNAESVRRHNAKVAYEALNDLPIEGLNIDAEKAKVQDQLNTTGNTRFIKPSTLSEKTWAQVFKDLEWTVEVEVTDETTDKEAVLTTLTTVMQTIATNPAVLKDPTMKILFNKILETTGAMSAVEMAQVPASPAETAPVAPAVGQQANANNGGQQLATK